MKTERTLIIMGITRFTGFVGNELPEDIKEFLADTQYTVENGVVNVFTDRMVLEMRPGDYLIRDENDDVFPVPADKMTSGMLKKFRQ